MNKILYKLRHQNPSLERSPCGSFLVTSSFVSFSLLSSNVDTRPLQQQQHHLLGEILDFCSPTLRTLWTSTFSSLPPTPTLSRCYIKTTNTMPSPHTNLSLLDPSQPTLKIASYPSIENRSLQTQEESQVKDMESIAGWLVDASTLESMEHSSF